MPDMLNISALNKVQFFSNGEYEIKKANIELKDGSIITHILTGEDLYLPVCITVNHEERAARMYFFDEETETLESVTGHLLQEKIIKVMNEITEQIEWAVENNATMTVKEFEELRNAMDKDDN